MRNPPSEGVPVIEDKCSCGSGKCGAVRHIEQMQDDLDGRMRELRMAEKQYNEAIRKLCLKAVGLVVILAAALPTAWASFLGLI